MPMATLGSVAPHAQEANSIISHVAALCGLASMTDSPAAALSAYETRWLNRAGRIGNP